MVKIYSRNGFWYGTADEMIDSIEAKAARIEALEAQVAAADALAAAGQGAGNWLASLQHLIEESDCNPDDENHFDEVLRGAIAFVDRFEDEIAAYNEAKKGGA